MSGLDRKTPIPPRSRCTRNPVLERLFEDGGRYQLPAEYLRVWSPPPRCAATAPARKPCRPASATLKSLRIEAVGNYAVKPTFSDGHDTGIYSWDLLHDLASTRRRSGPDYLIATGKAGASRDIDTTTQPPKSGGGCGKH